MTFVLLRGTSASPLSREKLRRLAKGFTNVTPGAPHDLAASKWQKCFSGICDAEKVVQSLLKKNLQILFFLENECLDILFGGSMTDEGIGAVREAFFVNKMSNGHVLTCPKLKKRIRLK